MVAAVVVVIAVVVGMAVAAVVVEVKHATPAAALDTCLAIAPRARSATIVSQDFHSPSAMPC